MKVEEVTADDTDFMDYLASDKLRNAFALYDLVEEADKIECLAASEEDSFSGYMLLWYGAGIPHAMLRGTREAAHRLLPRAPDDHCTLLTDSHLAGCAEEMREVTASFEMDLMTVDHRTAQLLTSTGARRLRADDGPAVSALFAEIGRGEDRDYAAWIDPGITYGVFDEERLVAVGGTHIRSKDLCLLGGIYTAKDHRMRGYAAQVTSAVTKEALREAPIVSLLVVSTNRPAIRLYEKLGYRKVAEWTWMDVGTGRTPLM